ncbi:MAG: T9SS type A sorting domain-containing protein, partial [Bacteroidales bacterium]|nr:T9SS type A sorting domain-containing protein [Bacteroidales bacterium]
IILLIVASIITFFNYPTPTENSVNGMQLEESGPDQRPSEWAWERRTFPYYKADAAAYREEMKLAQQMKAVAPQKGIQQIEFAGPSNIGGRISDIEFNPNDPNIVYAGAATGGVFKSIDMGNTWTAIFDDQANLNIGDIGIDPNNSDIIYVGTGEANGGHNNFPGGGIYKSVDAGENWEFIGLENTVSTGRVVVDPSNSDRIFVAAEGSYFTPNPERGVYRSEDGGSSWENVLFVSDSTGAIDIIIDPNNPDRLIAAMWERVRRPSGSHLYGPTSGMYRSLDGGDSWDYIEASAGLPNPQNENIGRIGIALCADQPDIVYAMYTDGSYYRGLFKSDDFGSSWTNADPDMEISDGTSSFSWYFGQVRVHPTNPEIVYALDVAFMRSTNGGNSWPIIYGYGGPSILHVDHHALAIHPDNPNYILNGNDGGINISTDGGVNFTKVADLPITQFYEIGLDRNNPSHLYGGTQDNGTMRTLTGWLNDWSVIYGGDGFYVLVDYTDPNIIYAESQNGNLGKSTNGGFSFNGATSGINGGEPRNWSTPVAMDPQNPEILYYGTNHVYRTVNGANYWNSISPDLTEGMTGNRPGTLSTIAVSPQNSDIIWAGTSDSKVWVSTDNGDNWTDVSETLPHRWVSRVVPDPLDENTAYVTFTGLKWADPESHVFRTTDAGENWEDISNNLPDAPVNAFAVDPVSNENLFVGTDLGAYYSGNSGESWEYLDADLPMVVIYDMKIHQTEHFLVLGTHARSMYKLDLSIFSGTEEETAATAHFTLEQNYPNPFSNETTIAFQLVEDSPVKIEIFDLQNRRVVSLLDQKMKMGAHQIMWNGFDDAGIRLPEAYYLCKMQAGNFSKTRKMLLVR